MSASSSSSISISNPQSTSNPASTAPSLISTPLTKKILLQIHTWTVHNNPHKPPHHWTVSLIPLIDLTNPTTCWKLYHIFDNPSGYEIIEEFEPLHSASFLGPELHSRYDVCLIDMKYMVMFDAFLKEILNQREFRWVELLAAYLEMEEWVGEKEAKALRKGVKVGRYEPGGRGKKGRKMAR
ncbi:hypothetical protein BDW68DRAFT_181290 [Aspergillus falconensis]